MIVAQSNMLYKSNNCIHKAAHTVVCFGFVLHELALLTKLTADQIRADNGFPEPVFGTAHSFIWLYCTNISWHNNILYCIVLYCIVLYCIVLYCIVLYCIVLCCAALRCVLLCCDMLCYPVLSYVMLCYVMLCYVLTHRITDVYSLSIPRPTSTICSVARS